MKRFGLLAALIFALAAAGCRRTEVVRGPVRVGEEFVTEEQIRAAWQARGGVDREQALEQLIVQRAAWQRAQAQGLDRDPALVAAFQRQVVEKMRGDFLEKHRAQTEVSAAEIEAAYHARAAEFAVPARAQAALIFVEAPATAAVEIREERRQRLQAARTAALALAPAEGFGRLAAELSFDQATRYKGGKLGWLVDGEVDPRLAPAAVKAIFSLRTPGEVSELIETPEGFALLRLMERQEATQRPLERVRGRIVQGLAVAKQEALAQAFVTQMKQGLRVEIDRPALDRLQREVGAKTDPASASPPAAPGS